MPASILLIDTLHDSFTTLLEDAGCKVIPAYDWSREKVLAGINQYQGLAIRSRFKIDAAFISHCSTLKCIARAGAGMENIDLQSAAAAGITCVNAPEGNRSAVGEHALGMLLMLNNHLLRADREVREGLWRREENRGTELEGKTIGMVGFGQMGSAFAQRLQGFGARLLALDPYVKIDSQKFPYVEQCDEALFFGECDVVSLHVPLTHETKYMVNDAWLNRFSKTITLVNTARGKNIDTAALVRALGSGKVRGAALDVLEYETLSFEDIAAGELPAPFQYLRTSERVVLSPHIGGWTHESNEKIARVLAQKMLAVLKP
ncbi:MAG: hydroxyacid dehydrogenase [Bacteroidia bacterium]|nr:hydroxyacid dehydrogenase [Bacteroidia bacterium]